MKHHHHHHHPIAARPKQLFQIRTSVHRRLLLSLLLLLAVSASLFLIPSSLRVPDLDAAAALMSEVDMRVHGEAVRPNGTEPGPWPKCATVEEMGEAFFRDGSARESLRVRKIIRKHFDLHGAARVRGLPSDHFCREGFVLGKASEAGFGNEMYKILTAAALSIMLNRSLIIGQNREKFPFEDYISYSNISFTLQEVKHLWRKNKCIEKFGRQLTMRFDDFERPGETNVLCSDWRAWKHPIIWFEGTSDAVACQFFLKNIHQGMKDAASLLFGSSESLKSRPNVFGELMSLIISPSGTVKEAVDWALSGGSDPDLAIHMRMMTNRPIRAMHAALSCVKRALDHYQSQITSPRIVLISDTPSFVEAILPNLTKMAKVIRFDYNSYMGGLQVNDIKAPDQLNFRAKDWGPAPRWVAFVDFFLASRAKHAVITGAHRRVGTTYAQLVAALASANHLADYGDDSHEIPNFSFFSSFQSSLLDGGLGSQIGWGHIWNRFAGPLSCRNQSHQCAFTPLLAPAWWDGDWQSPISRDIQRLQDYGVQLNDDGKVVESSLQSYCKSKKESVKVFPIIQKCNNSKCI